MKHRTLQIVLTLAVIGVGAPRVQAQRLSGSEAADERLAQAGADQGAGEPAQDPGAPTRDAEDLDLEALLQIPIRGGEAGSFGYQLESYGVTTFVHAYTTFDAIFETDAEGDFNSDTFRFDAHYFNLFVGANLYDRVLPEVQLELEHGSEEIAVRFAQVDVVLDELAIVRVGLFLVPLGRFNELQYPEYLSLLPRGPVVRVHRELIPVAWNEVGVQVRGRTELSDGMSLDYAVYAVNGLRQSDDPGTEVNEAEAGGGRIRAMRGNYSEVGDGDKAVGGRIGFSPIPELQLGLSAYNGAYTETSNRRVTFLALDASLEMERFTARTEGVIIWQDAEGGDIQRWGTYTRLGYFVTDWLQPAVGFELYDLTDQTDGTAMQFVECVNFHLFPDLPVNVIARLAAWHRFDDDADADHHGLMSQLTVGF